MKTETDMIKNKKHSCVIVDDDPLLIELLEAYINDTPELTLAGSFNNASQAIQMLSKEQNIDFLFLDIKMNGISGIEAAVKLRDIVKYLIFITAYSQYAMDAHQVNADQFLLKPVDYSKFISCLNDLLAKNNRQQGLT
ncbi:LytR/AlgR family response regulator transcription factor [Pedobacter sp. KLB.chiD]|uniref:LytR/AlgR family response regulator transcription factor n=1 Tax=Pedobacter sp. KLB.chiD TaxID=3387402 RepID=UPI00399BF970